MQPSDRKTFDLIVDGRYAELKAKAKPFTEFDFFWLSEAQYKAALGGPDYLLFLVCGLGDGHDPEILEIPAARLRAVPPKSAVYYFYDTGLVRKLIGG